METNRIIRITSESMKSSRREKFLENIFTNRGIKVQSQGRCKGDQILVEKRKLSQCMLGGFQRNCRLCCIFTILQYILNGLILVSWWANEILFLRILHFCKHHFSKHNFSKPTRNKWVWLSKLGIKYLRSKFLTLWGRGWAQLTLVN